MAFNIQNFARITAAGQSVAPALNAYGTSDTFATATASGYFNDNALNLNVGDIIFINASDSNLAVQVTATTPNVTVSVISNYDTALADGRIFVGNGSNIATPVAMSGDITIDNTGETTIGKVLDGGNAGNVAVNSVLGAVPVLHAIAVTGGATASYDVVLTNKTVVTDVWVQFNGAGAAGDTIQVLNTAAAITNAMDGNQLDTAIVRAANINDANATINAGGTLRVTQTDAAGSNAPPCTVYVLGWHVA
jgi:hypothetical protein